MDSIKRSEEERVRQKRLKKEKQEQARLANFYKDCDDRFAFIAGYTSGGAAFGTTWEEMGIDPMLPFEEKVHCLMTGDFSEDRDSETLDENEIDNWIG